MKTMELNMNEMEMITGANKFTDILGGIAAGLVVGSCSCGAVGGAPGAAIGGACGAVIGGIWAACSD